MVLICNSAYGRYIPNLVCSALRCNLKPSIIASKAKKLNRLFSKIEDNERYGEPYISKKQKEVIEDTLIYLWEDISDKGYVVASIDEMYSLNKQANNYSFLPKKLKWKIMQDDDVWLIPQTDYVVPFWVDDFNLCLRRSENAVSERIHLDSEVIIDDKTSIEATYTSNGESKTISLYVEAGYLMLDGEVCNFKLTKLVRSEEYIYRLPNLLQNMQPYQFINYVVKKEKQHNKKHAH